MVAIAFIPASCGTRNANLHKRFHYLLLQTLSSVCVDESPAAVPPYERFDLMTAAIVSSHFRCV